MVVKVQIQSSTQLEGMMMRASFNLFSHSPSLMDRM
jgi:hypothetical protein